MNEKDMHRILIFLLIVAMAYGTWSYFYTSRPTTTEKGPEEKALEALTAPNAPPSDYNIIMNHHELTAPPEEIVTPDTKLKNGLTAPN